VEEMSANWNTADHLIIIETFHTNNTVGGIKFIGALVKPEVLNLVDEHFDVFLF
jgi:hypothetical protein